MEKLEVGMYVRTNFGGIFTIADEKPVEINNEVFIRISSKDTYDFIRISDITKGSNDIANVVELGDIIKWKTEHNYGINEVINYLGDIGVYAIEEDYCIPLEELSILRVLTHEQFEKEGFVIGK